MKPRRGRPPRANKAATERIEIRVTKLERAAWNHKAIEAGVPLSEWIRAACQFAHAVFPRVQCLAMFDGRICVLRQGHDGSHSDVL